LITGGLTGIGRAAAVAFAKKGANVVVAGRRDEAGKALVRSCALSVRRPSSSTPCCRVRRDGVTMRDTMSVPIIVDAATRARCPCVMQRSPS
jgi:NAD(P)-dependent dehydrogenase (short-subunit alcohol dehydrogenase family)